MLHFTIELGIAQFESYEFVDLFSQGPVDGVGYKVLSAHYSYIAGGDLDGSGGYAHAFYRHMVYAEPDAQVVLVNFVKADGGLALLGFAGAY